MPIRKHEPVALGPLGIFRVLTQNMEVKRGKNISHAQRPADMTRACIRDHLNHILTDMICHLLQKFNLVFVEMRHITSTDYIYSSICLPPWNCTN